MNEALSHVTDVRQGLALEAALFDRPDNCRGLWQSATPALVCPAAYQRQAGFERAAERSAARGWPVSCRPSGGGAVPQGIGVVNLAMAVTVRRGFLIEDGYRLITDPIRAVLRDLGLEATTGATPYSFCDGRWNLSIDGRKLVGTAQRWRPLPRGQMRILTHALVLHDLAIPARAVDAFHRDLGLGPIRAEAHITLGDKFGDRLPGAEDFAAALQTAADDALARIDRPPDATRAS